MGARAATRGSMHDRRSTKPSATIPPPQGSVALGRHHRCRGDPSCPRAGLDASSRAVSAPDAGATAVHRVGDPGRSSNKEVATQLVRWEALATSGSLGDEEPPEAAAARVRADAELVEFLRAKKFAGPEWDQFVTELFRHAYPILGVWARSGKIFDEARKRGIPLPPPTGVMSRTDIEDLATDAVANALIRFGDQLKEGQGWRPGESALTTYFVTRCIYEFVSLYRRRFRRVARELPSGFHFEQLVDDLPVAERSMLEDSVVESLMVLDALRGLPERMRTIAVLSAAGYSDVEIANELGITARAIEGIRHRYRKSRTGSDGTSHLACHGGSGVRLLPSRAAANC